MSLSNLYLFSTMRVNDSCDSSTNVQTYTDSIQQSGLIKIECTKYNKIQNKKHRLEKELTNDLALNVSKGLIYRYGLCYREVFGL